MKWLILQNNGEHHGQDEWTANSFLRECFTWKDALLRAGARMVDVTGPGHPGFNQALAFQPERFAALCDVYDYVLVAEQYDYSWIPRAGLAGVQRAKKLHWIVDLHVRGEDAYLPISQHCDYALHATRSLMEPYRARLESANPVKPTTHLWFPNFADDRYFHEGRYRNMNTLLSTDRPLRFTFIGGRGHGERERIISAVERETDLWSRYGVTGYDYIRELLKTKVALNVPVAGDLNYRTFEALGLGCCLLQHRHSVESGEALYALGLRDGVNYHAFDEPAEAVLLYRDLMRTGKWREIGNAGRELFISRHTAFARISELLKFLKP